MPPGPTLIKIVQVTESQNLPLQLLGQAPGHSIASDPFAIGLFLHGCQTHARASRPHPSRCSPAISVMRSACKWLKIKGYRSLRSGVWVSPATQFNSAS